jgi:cytochrome c
MKKLIVVIALTGFTCWTITSCGSKKEEAKEETEEAYSDYETAEPENAAPETSTGNDLIAQGQALVNESDCKICHHSTNKLIGPAHLDVAKKYEFTQANITLLADKIISGGSGVWGEVPMTAHADISKGDAEKMAMYVLSLDGETQK